MSDWPKQLSHMNVRITQHKRQEFDRSLKSVQALLKRANLAPNNTQKGIAVAMLLQRVTRVFLTMPSG